MLNVAGCPSSMALDGSRYDPQTTNRKGKRSGTLLCARILIPKRPACITGEQLYCDSEFGIILSKSVASITHETAAQIHPSDCCRTQLTETPHGCQRHPCVQHRVGRNCRISALQSGPGAVNLINRFSQTHARPRAATRQTR